MGPTLAVKMDSRWGLIDGRTGLESTTWFGDLLKSWEYVEEGEYEEIGLFFMVFEDSVLDGWDSKKCEY